MKRLLPSLRILGSLVAAVLVGATGALLATCGPFVDVAADSFCPFVLEVFNLAITTGTTPTTYDPSSAVTRLQMAAFLSRTVDRTLQRANRRAALRRFWTPGSAVSLGVTPLGGAAPYFVESDGTDVWTGDLTGSAVWRIRGSDGKLIETYGGANAAAGILSAGGRIFVAGDSEPGKLYFLDPMQGSGAVATVASNLGGLSFGIAFDGVRIWTANSAGSVSIVTPGGSIPWTVTTVTTGGSPQGILFDGANMWVTDAAGTIRKLDAAGTILQTVTVGGGPDQAVFDGNNIWVPNANSDSISVVRASTGAVLATLTGNGLDGPEAAGFDGQRVLVANSTTGINTVSLFKAADFTALGSFSTGTGTTPFGVCSDGVNFWIALTGTGSIARF